MTPPVGAASAAEARASESHARPKFRSVYRDSSGQLHHDWSVDRLSDAIGDTAGLVWLDIEDPNGASNGDVERLLADVFQFHPLAIEDALRESHIPKVDDWGDYLYIVFQVAGIDTDRSALLLKELDIFLGKNFLVTYHTDPIELFDKERASIERDPRDRLRHGPDHLLYRFLEVAIDEALAAIEDLDESVDALQNEVVSAASTGILHKIFRVKRAAIRLHKTLSPQREVLNRLARDPFEPIQPKHRVYFRDLYDHLVRIHDISEGLRDLISGTLETYLSVVSNRTNDIMKALTMVTVMFLPMTFLAGFFGMNFFGESLAFKASLPRWPLFIGTCIVMIASPCVMWFYAIRKKWL
jgi:magnesium transporter